LIIEIEIIEQIEDEAFGRSVDWVCDLIRSLGRDDPFVVLQGMWRSGYIDLADGDGESEPQWKSEELLRNQVPTDRIRVFATQKGLDWVHGPPT
jgi:hypothetical protein